MRATLSVCLASLALLGCTLTEKVAIGFSMLRLPVTVRTPEANTCMEPVQRLWLDRVGEAIVEEDASRQQAIRDNEGPDVTEPQCRKALLRDPIPDRIDDHRDVAHEQTIVVVAISGGGARAARLGAHTLARLEQKYNEYVEEQKSGQDTARELRPMACLFAAFSTVSGGSIYASYVASHYADVLGRDDAGDRCGDARDPLEELRTTFQDVRDDPLGGWGQQKLGPVAGVAYLSPTFLFLLPVLTLTTDRSFTDVLAHGVRLTQGNPLFSETMFSDLPQRPRFFFNALAVETGAPFVLTQRIQHLPSDYRPAWTARIDVERNEKPDPARTLATSLTLEDLNSSPGLFPLSYAAMASAAFPPVMEPVAVRQYGLDYRTNDMYATSRTLNLTDGGVFDNSGLLTAVDFFTHLVHEVVRLGDEGERPTRRLILLSINAETTRALGNRMTVVRGEESQWNIGVNWPVRGLGFRAIDRIHYTNKRRGEEIAWHRLTALKRTMEPRVDVELLYFPVNLTQLSELDPFAIEHGENLFEQVQEIPTDYLISNAHDRLLAAAVEQILAADQSGDGRHEKTGWDVGPEGEPIYRLDDAFVRAMLRAQNGAWNGDSP